ncbi:MAG: saccharopine dehydrogenase NADP-binding domain-containing protein, partial [Bacteroidetes bacterium]|nr:saccharopine dehydrogenase NADP-binding domain-containing protein [Bacteroidota bacterium]
MRHILVIGAGRSATNLINYLAEKATDQQLEITVADLSLEAANKNIQGMAHTRGIALDVNDADQRQSLIQAHDLVISMLPAHMHLDVAKDCLTYGKHMV